MCKMNAVLVLLFVGCTSRELPTGDARPGRDLAVSTDTYEAQDTLTIDDMPPPDAVAADVRPDFAGFDLGFYQCPMIEDGGCPPQCQSVKGQSYDPSRKCLGPPGVVSCLSTDHPFFQAVSCAARDDGALFITWADYMLYPPYFYGWRMCSQIEAASINELDCPR